jgi:DNA-binding response OmpR family regulator
VDDDEDTCTLVIALFPNFKVITANSAAEALLYASNELFDIFLLDNWLPDVSGVDLCRKLRALHPNTPVVFWSGAAYEKDRQEALAVGAQAYIVKPANFSELQRTIDGLILQAGLDSLAAKTAELAAIHDGIKERLAEVESTLDGARAALVKANAFHAFIAAGGTRAHFERLWPEVKTSVLAD